MDNIDSNIVTYIDLKSMIKSDEYKHLGVYNYSKLCIFAKEELGINIERDDSNIIMKYDNGKLCKLQKSELKMKMQKLTTK